MDVGFTSRPFSGKTQTSRARGRLKQCYMSVLNGCGAYGRFRDLEPRARVGTLRRILGVASSNASQVLKCKVVLWKERI